MQRTIPHPRLSRHGRVRGWYLISLLPGLVAACGGGAYSQTSPGANPAGSPLVPTVSLSASPSTVTSGGSATLNWLSLYADSCSASGAWSGSKSTSGSQMMNSIASTRTYTLTCIGKGGSKAASATVTVGSATAPTLAFSANPTVVSSGGNTTLSWTGNNVSSCIAGGAWSGTKGTTGSEIIAVPATSTYTLDCSGANGSINSSVTVLVATGGAGGLAMPSLDDERNTYTSWGWTWTPDKEPGAVTERVSNYYVTNVDIHGDLEGDDLWTYTMMYRRTGNPVYLNRAQQWARYFKDEYRTSSDFDYDRGFLLDHLFGWGLVAWYEYTGDTAALAEAENIAAEVEAYWNEKNSSGNPKFIAGQTRMGEFSLRQGARHLLLATRVAEATGKQRWITLRDKLIDLWLKSPDWDARGMYFVGSYYTDEALAPNTDCKYTGASNCPYEQGARDVPSFHIGILTEAFDQAFRVTGRTELRDRIVAMAHFVDQYGLDPTYQYTGKTFGFLSDGSLWHSYSLNGPTTFWDPAYTTSLVNTLVRGYRYTGDRSLYDRAKYFFNRGTKGIYGEAVKRAAADNVVAHFVDTQFASSTGFVYLDNNKGELQYSYLMFAPP